MKVCDDDLSQRRWTTVWPLRLISHHPSSLTRDRIFPSPFSTIHVHRLNIVWAGRSRRLTVGTATRAILVNICCMTRGHSEWALIPTQPCCGGKHSFLLVSADKQGRGVLLVTCRQPASWKDRECCRLRGPQLCHRPLWLCRGVWPPATAASCHHWSSWMDLGFEVNERWCDWARSGGPGGVCQPALFY